MWHPDSWQALPLSQFPPYPDAAALSRATAELRRLPPLVTTSEIDRLQSQLADAAAGKRFLLQGGDCAESFADCTSERITSKLKILLQMSLVLLHGLNVPIVRVGRIAGQYAKPRSDESETRDGITLPSYRGDLINDAEFSLAARTPDPQRLLTGYSLASLTLNYIRALTESGFTDLAEAEHWNLDFMAQSPRAADYQHIVDEVRRAFARENGHGVAAEISTAARQRGLDKMAARPDFPATGFAAAVFSAAIFPAQEVFTCHEALHLHYESALTRKASLNPDAQGRWYNFSTHLPWVGMRTADLHGAHIEYLRGIANPVAVKVGPGLSGDGLRALCERLNPARIPGRLTLIHRFGASRIQQHLPALIDAVRQDAHPVLWVCDPMHGNTQLTASGIKTRRFDDILSELEQAFALHRQQGSVLGGVHFELTGEAVTECIGGARGLDEAGLDRAYHSLVDPRLNGEQALEMALAIVRMRQGRPAIGADIPANQQVGG
ncbi:3-deoxy-7-phosphoheptulonate synthase [Permianibacter sp. IMCC34836]|uniref:3-deoxy-7-phosphoheptulonate synthase class II n=1 Tax=Permianibacter fluminis TaxID=2738515 RepID=UPI00155269E3|nr:3-deoxy-7-phosphoheptulonate synthase class II [Permianibacter fluminis]NQD38941.1 3-deoxy-7-phosphoheptulonate synthase [Permianibacter fluminis]